jgi:hypothetical protein
MQVKEVDEGLVERFRQRFDQGTPEQQNELIAVYEESHTATNRIRKLLGMSEGMDDADVDD